MNQVIISNIDERTVQGLKQLAWRRGLPLEESLRRLLSEAVEADLGKWRSVASRARGAAKAPAGRVAGEAA
jgi:hypothetical protein